jgi:O-antigen/teichoic acid export membrane protein
MIGSAFTYLFNMLVGRLLGPVGYGEFSSIMSLMMILSVGGGALTIICMKYSSELFASQNYPALKRLIKFFSKNILYLGLILLVLGLIFVRTIANYLSIQDSVPIKLALVSFIPGLLIIINKGFLQGTQNFFSFSIIGILEALLRLLIGLLFIWLGFHTSGVMAGVLLAVTIAYGASFLPILKIFKKRKSKKSAPYAFNKKEMLWYAVPSLVASVFLAIAFNIDIILVKHYFDPETAGNYAAISTIAKIIFYATGPIVGVMFPMISEKTAKGDRHYWLFLGSLAMTLFAALIILACYYIAPGTIIKLLYGEKYLSHFSLLPIVGFAMVLYSLINLIVNYFMVIKNYFFVAIFLLIIILQIFLVFRFHSSLELFAKIMVSTFGLLFSLLFAYYLITKRKQIISFLRNLYEQES